MPRYNIIHAKQCIVQQHQYPVYNTNAFLCTNCAANFTLMSKRCSTNGIMFIKFSHMDYENDVFNTIDFILILLHIFLQIKTYSIPYQKENENELHLNGKICKADYTLYVFSSAIISNKNNNATLILLYTDFSYKFIINRHRNPTLLLSQNPQVRVFAENNISCLVRRRVLQ